MSKPFVFKQFTVQHDRCAMKIGTDGVLLGAWAPVSPHTSSILDIGAGTGIIALQLAQRSHAPLIDAIEIDEAAYEQCVENFEDSPWGDRLFCYHAGLDEFVAEIDDRYDLIVSNPPFYTEDYPCEHPEREKARFEASLPFGDLLEGVSRLLTETGVFATILPKKEEVEFIRMASEVNLFPKRICRVRGTAASEEKRGLLEFSFKETTPEISSLTIETERHNYTEAYKNLVKDFYLKM
ncbi:methyltransferase [Altibacter sp.]|uniref:tRNA1(Val) (adenine(37)-N6)-methyltransferase n=1 Tax=Altibacter sp. TaxID=2024823 RepID=UPI000C940B3A|nr:methyltransferase [Altibacter sp.]MAP53805.1 tRNA (adenine-N(6)-)-methyltransferase [Altibacter sp.]